MRLAACIIVLGLASGALADKLVSQGLSQTVTFSGFANNKLQYQNERGGSGEREYGRITQIVVDNEPALTAAEVNFAAGKSDVALDDYAKAIRTSATPWVKVFASRRLLDAAGPIGRFEPRLIAYLTLLQLSPADAANARPALPDKGSQLLNVAVTEIESVLKAPKLSEPVKIDLLNFLADVHRQRGDETAVAATIDRLAKASPTAAANPAVQAQVVAQKLTQARAALDVFDYATARKLITQNSADITNPLQQSDALFILAKCQFAMSDPNDSGALQDAALAFMRVVTHSKDLPGRPNVLASLRSAADILLKVGRADDAAKLRAQIAQEFPGQ